MNARDLVRGDNIPGLSLPSRDSCSSCSSLFLVVREKSGGKESKDCGD